MRSYTLKGLMIRLFLFFILMLGISYIVIYGQGGIPLIFFSIFISFIFYFLFFDFFYKYLRNKNRENQNPLLATIEEKQSVFMCSFLLSLFLFEVLTFSSLVFSDEKKYTGKVFSKEVGVDKFGHKYNVRVRLDKERQYNFNLCYSNDFDIYINQNIFLYYKDTLFGIRFIKGYKRDSDNNKLLLVGCNMFTKLNSK